MNLFKKILTTAIATMTVFTAITAMASAADSTMTLTAVPAEDKSYVDLTLSTSSTVLGRICGLGATIGCDQDVFSADLNLTDEEIEEGTYSTFLEKVVDGEIEGFSTALNAKRASNMSTLQLKNNKISVVFSTGTNYGNAVTIPATQENIFTIRLTVEGGASNAIWTDGYTFELLGNTCSLTDINNVSAKDNNDTLETIDAVIEGTGSQEPTGYTREGDTPVYESAVADGNGDKAVGFTKVVDLTSGAKYLEAVAKWVKADQKTVEDKTLEIAIPETDAVTKIGLIVKFDATYHTVDVTSITASNGEVE